MKKLYVILISLMIVLNVNSNPIAVPFVEFSELFFDSNGKWSLELRYDWFSETDTLIDQIVLMSSQDTVELNNIKINDSSGVLVFNPDSLESNFTINDQGDRIELWFYIANDMWTEGSDVLIFGNYEGAEIGYPKNGQSIAKINWYYVKDVSPTIGFLNDTSGMCGTLTGILYDKYINPVSNRTFEFDNEFITSEFGEYSARVFSKPTTLRMISYSTRPGVTISTAIESFDYTMEPDSIIYKDIYILGDLKPVSIRSTAFDDIIKIYPNPILHSSQIKIHIDLPVQSSNIQIEIIDLKGILIKKEKINQKESLVEVPNKTGLFIFNILLDNQIISSESILVND